jgi:uncharacterized damage-inducible protein DinB
MNPMSRRLATLSPRSTSRSRIGSRVQNRNRLVPTEKAGAHRPAISDRQTVTPAEARRALRQSTDDLAKLFDTALRSRQARVKGMPRRVIDMLTYLIQHDAHHRGQICMLARDLGHTFSGDDSMRMWRWKKGIEA